MRGRDVAQRIESLGGELIRQKGSHRRYRIVYMDAEGQFRTDFTTVPMHDRDMPIGTLRSIQRDLENAFGKGWLQ